MRIQNLIYFLSILFGMIACDSYHPADKEMESSPSIFPDYASVTFPVNIAPPNFIIQEEGEGFQTEIGMVEAEPSFIVHSNQPVVQIPIKKWRELLNQASGKEIFFRISILQNDHWVRYDDIRNIISSQPIDE